MGASGSCRICARPDIAAIDQRLLSGGSVKAMSRDFGLPRSTIQVHWDRCRKKGRVFGVDPKPPESAEPGGGAIEASDAPRPEVLRIPRSDPVDDDSSIARTLQELRAVHGVALKEYSAAHKGNDSRLIALLLPQLRANIELREKLIAKTSARQSPAERLLENPEFAVASRILFQALDDYPEAKQAVSAALERFLNGNLSRLHE